MYGKRYRKVWVEKAVDWELMLWEGGICKVKERRTCVGGIVDRCEIVNRAEC